MIPDVSSGSMLSKKGKVRAATLGRSLSQQERGRIGAGPRPMRASAPTLTLPTPPHHAHATHA